MAERLIATIKDPETGVAVSAHILTSRVVSPRVEAVGVDATVLLKTSGDYTYVELTVATTGECEGKLFANDTEFEA